MPYQYSPISILIGGSYVLLYALSKIPFQRLSPHLFTGTCFSQFAFIIAFRLPPAYLRIIIQKQLTTMQAVPQPQQPTDFPGLHSYPTVSSQSTRCLLLRKFKDGVNQTKIEQFMLQFGTISAFDLTYHAGPSMQTNLLELHIGFVDLGSAISAFDHCGQIAAEKFYLKCHQQEEEAVETTRKISMKGLQPCQRCKFEGIQLGGNKIKEIIDQLTSEKFGNDSGVIQFTFDEQTCDCEVQFSRQKEAKGARNMCMEKQLYESIEFVKESEYLPSEEEEITKKKEEFLMQFQQYNGYLVELTAGLNKFSEKMNAYLL